MRFVKLTLTNITSLRGVHVLDFNEALGEEELFAITGATGSGKSSLLTAITLALYGNTYKTLNQWEYVTQDEEEASIDLEFKSNGISYRALWRCRKHVDKHGVLRPKYSRELLANGEMTDRPIEDVVGLNFEQFKKTIILNQGQFADFLTASFSDRKAILENLAGAELLSKLSKTLKEKVKTIGSTVSELEARLDGGLPFSDEELLQMRQRIEELEKNRPKQIEISEKFTKDQKTLKELVKWIEDVTRYRTDEDAATLELQGANDRLQGKKNEQREWQVKFDDFRSKRDSRRPQLKIALELEKALAQKSVSEQSIANKEQLRTKKDLIWEQENKANQARLNKLSGEQQELTPDREYEKLSEISLRAIEALIGEWDEGLKKLTIIDTNASNVQERMQAIKKRGDIIALEMKEYKKKEVELAANSKEGLDLQQQQKMLEALTVNLPLLEESNRHENDLKRRSATKTLELNELTSQINSRQAELKLKITSFDHLNLKKYQIELGHAISMIQKENSNQPHCLACEQDIPHDHNVKVKSVAGAEVKTSTTLDQLRTLEKEITAEQIRTESLLTRSNDLNHEIKKLNIDLEQCLSKIKPIKDALQESFNTVDPTVLREMRTTKQASVQELERTSNERQRIKDQLEAKEAERTQLLNEWAEQSRKKENLDVERKTTADQLTRSFSDLSSRLPALPKQFDEAKAFLKEQARQCQLKEKLLVEEKSLQEKIQQGLKDFKERSLERDHDAKEQTVLLQEIQQIQDQLKPLIPEGSVSKAIAALDREEDEWSSQKDKWNALLKELEQKSEHCRTRYSFIVEQLKKARIELERTLSQLSTQSIAIKAVSESGFARGFEKIKQLKRAQEVEAASSEIKLWFDNYFTPEFDAAQSALKAMDTELIELRKSLEIDAKKRKEMESFRRELEIALSQKKRWDTLAQVLGQDEFRGFALGLVEERLVEQTNKELEHLCEGRYQITLLENKKQSQDFLVVDHWRGGGERKVSTLSGGETFLVSLAMALSLAELTRGQTEVDAFFIDEGFGTLDRDSIDDVLEVLSSVQSRGKQIGLISHVKALTDRIPVNLHLEKSTLGDSKIRVIYN
tara:strand:- start:50043 stop:53309 length:3267 start_codon:yes stop_codon:yes gene_type:complete